jgi:methionyl-tRNA formyltransferase
LINAVAFINADNFLFEAARLELEQYFRIIHLFHDKLSYTKSQDEVCAEAECVISFLNVAKVGGIALTKPNINFHPGPPWYPGRGGTSFAIFNGQDKFGATAHRMTDKFDAGEIYYTTYFGIEPHETCETLRNVAHMACFELLRRFCAHVARTGEFPAPNGEKWSGKNYSLGAFREWMTVTDLSDIERIEKLVRACKHSRFPGPFIKIGRHKFSYFPADTKSR